jgi:DNA-directed RNA polymerase specialized sigma subunit
MKRNKHISEALLEARLDIVEKQLQKKEELMNTLMELIEKLPESKQDILDLLKKENETYNT